jgi:hypothetical protein
VPPKTRQAKKCPICDTESRTIVTLWHFLFDLLTGKNPYALEQRNAWIAEFRSVVRNPDVAAAKADEELSNSPPERIGDFMAEVFAVIKLSRDGYTDFEAVLARGERRWTLRL